MKRHPSLAPLSREHHGALILAKLLQKDAPVYKGLPANTQGKIEYAIKYYHEELARHFEEEEKVFKLVTGINSGIDLTVRTILREHGELHASFNSISSQADMLQAMDELGKALETHIRREERELFPAIQETCSEVVLAAIGDLLSNGDKKMEAV